MRKLLLLCEDTTDKVTQMMNRTYSELITLPTFEERFEYLKLSGTVGKETFGYDRYLNQMFYKLPEWLEARDYVIIRDNGCDLGIEGREIHGRILVHHMNPITMEDILNRNRCLFDPENLISTVKNTHDAIHYSDESILVLDPIERSKNDTCPWRH